MGLPHLCQHLVCRMPRSITQMRWALPYWLSIFCWKPRNLVLSAVLPGKTSNVSGKPSGVTIKRDHHPHAITALVAALAVTAAGG